MYLVQDFLKDLYLLILFIFLIVLLISFRAVIKPILALKTSKLTYEATQVNDHINVSFPDVAKLLVTRQIERNIKTGLIRVR